MVRKVWEDTSRERSAVRECRELGSLVLSGMPRKDDDIFYNASYRASEEANNSSRRLFPSEEEVFPSVKKRRELRCEAGQISPSFGPQSYLELRR